MNRNVPVGEVEDAGYTSVDPAPPLDGAAADYRAKVAQLNHRSAKRVLTRVPRSAKKRTLEAKARRARIKQLRSKPATDE